MIRIAIIGLRLLGLSALMSSDLSKTLQGNVADGKLFTPYYFVEKLMDVFKKLSKEQTGKCFAWDGQEILP